MQGAFTWCPSHLTFQPFVDMWTTVPLARYFVNSLDRLRHRRDGVSVAIAIFAAYAV